MQFHFEEQFNHRQERMQGRNKSSGKTLYQARVDKATVTGHADMLQHKVDSLLMHQERAK